VVRLCWNVQAPTKRRANGRAQASARPQQAVHPQASTVLMCIHAADGCFYMGSELRSLFISDLDRREARRLFKTARRSSGRPGWRQMSAEEQALVSKTRRMNKGGLPVLVAAQSLRPILEKRAVEQAVVARLESPWRNRAKVRSLSLPTPPPSLSVCLSLYPLPPASFACTSMCVFTSRLSLRLSLSHSITHIFILRDSQCGDWLKSMVCSAVHHVHDGHGMYLFASCWSSGQV
jgi:hypothetical protein